MVKLGKRCNDCQGVGTVPASDGDPSPQLCIPCEGTGYERWGEIDLSDLITKLDALQADMDIIKPQIQALYDDLNP